MVPGILISNKCNFLWIAVISPFLLKHIHVLYTLSSSGISSGMLPPIIYFYVSLANSLSIFEVSILSEY